MNKDQVKGKAKDIAGKVQEKAGELTGSEKQQIKGLKNQAEGKIRKQGNSSRCRQAHRCFPPSAPELQSVDLL